MLPDLTQIRKITVPDLLSDPLGSYVPHGDLSGDAMAEAVAKHYQSLSDPKDAARALRHCASVSLLIVGIALLCIRDAYRNASTMLLRHILK